MDTRAAEPIVRLTITPTPALVRTARLVAVAAAREFGADEQLLEEIKLAVSEACTRAISVTQDRGLVGMSISLDGVGQDARITLMVSDHGTYSVAESDPASGWQLVTGVDCDASSEAPLLLGGLVDDVEIGPAPDGVGTVVRASWPTHRHRQR